MKPLECSWSGWLQPQNEPLCTGLCCPSMWRAAHPFPWVINSPILLGSITLQSCSALVHSALSNLNCTKCSCGQDLRSCRAGELQRVCYNRARKQLSPSSPTKTSWDVSVCSLISWDRFLVWHFVWKFSFSRSKESQFDGPNPQWPEGVGVNSSCLVQGYQVAYLV